MFPSADRIHNRPGPARRGVGAGFSLVELLIVIAIIALLLGILLPAIGLVRNKAKAARAEAQLHDLGNAARSYQQDFGAYPGYLPETTISENTWNEFPCADNMAVAMLGGVESGGSYTIEGTPIDPGQVGSGPLTESGRRLDPYYPVETGELHVATGDYGTANPVPDIIDPINGMPVLYMRSVGGGTQPVGIRLSNGGTYHLVGQLWYTRKSNLQTNDEAFDQTTESLLGNAAQASADAATNLAWLVVDKNAASTDLSNGPNGGEDIARQGFVLLSAGPDGIYMNKEANGGNQAAIGSLNAWESFMSGNDDQVFYGGTQ